MSEKKKTLNQIYSNTFSIIACKGEKHIINKKKKPSGTKINIINCYHNTIYTMYCII